jgi:hypothetical protein
MTQAIYLTRTNFIITGIEIVMPKPANAKPFTRLSRVLTGGVSKSGKPKCKMCSGEKSTVRLDGRNFCHRHKAYVKTALQEALEKLEKGPDGGEETEKLLSKDFKKMEKKVQL